MRQFKPPTRLIIGEKRFLALSVQVGTPIMRLKTSPTVLDRAEPDKSDPCPSTIPKKGAVDVLLNRQPSRLAMFNLIPGPMVVLTVTRFIYVNFTPLGLALEIAPTKASRFSVIASAEKLALPTPA